MQGPGKTPPTSQPTAEAVLADQKNTGKIKSTEPTLDVPRNKSSGKDKKGRSLFKRNVSKDNVKAASVKPSKGKKPHHNYGYMAGGAVAMMVGAGILALAPPIGVVGIPIFIMGLVAYAYAFCNFDQPQPTFNNQNNQKQDDNKRKKDQDDRDKSNSKTPDNRRADGSFVAQPVDFSGGQVEFPPHGPPPVQPPPFQPGYSGPNWQDIYGVATGLGMPPVSANNFMNACFQHLGGGQPPRQLNNPTDVINMPLAMGWANNNNMQQLSAGGLPRIEGVNSLFSPPVINSGYAAPGQQPAIVINNINGADKTNEEHAVQRTSLPFDMNEMISRVNAQEIQKNAEKCQESTQRYLRDYYQQNPNREFTDKSEGVARLNDTLDQLDEDNET